MGSDGGAWAMDPETAYDTYFVPQGIGADLIATIEGFTREDVDAYAVRSQERAGDGLGRRLLRQVRRAGQGPQRRDRARPRRAHAPRHHRRRLGKLKPVLRRHRRAWAASTPWRCRSTTGSRRSTTSTPRGNSSGIVDGAALVLDRLRARPASDVGLTPRARIVAAAVTGSEPTIMLTGPTPGHRKGARQAPG